MTDQSRSADLRADVDADNGVLWLTLNRPKAGNAITAGQREELIAWMAEATADPDIRAVVLTGAGDRHFCTGADLAAGNGDSSADNGSERTPGSIARAISGGAQRLISAVLDCEKPVIAAVNGTAAGIGCHLAFACDLVIAAESAKFVEVFVRRGLVVDGGGAYLLTRLVGPQMAKKLIYFGDDVPVAEAHRIGLVSEVVPAEKLTDVASEWATRLASGPTIALALGKQLINRALDVDRATAFAEEAWAAEINMTSADGQEGLRAFVERRSPVFRGR
ncbi:enoyl-CoA hydratase/isomerase family protein [Nocardia sp.]|uniref:enoyl-CoA hydratase/isomerase family protein n=1 Tax=Nocardia sp. TaxID=1821 RepID=UPI0026274EC1|nr:enoyl-CoA hydratase-related protein [Nocardia sp.]